MRLLSKLDEMVIVSFVTRTVIALFAGFALGFAGWLLAWLLIPLFGFTSLALPAVSSVVLGATTSVAAAFVFTDPDRSRSRNLAMFAAVVCVAIVACVITFAVSVNASNFTYLTRGIVFPMINAGTFAATFTAGGLYLYGELAKG